MTHPVPGWAVSTPYGIRGSHWSCNRDSSGRGIHTGLDVAAPTGTRVVAARPGVVRHVAYGSAFGTAQVAVQVDSGAGGGADFYAHMSSRVPAGTRVEAGDPVGAVGASGNVTGPHLHFERHTVYGSWSCSVVTDPAPSIDWEDPGMAISNEDIDRIVDAVWSRKVHEDKSASWMLAQAQRITRRYLGPSGDAPAGDTMLARIDHNTR